MGIFGRILDGSSEKQVIERSRGIVEQAIAANEILKRVINGYNGLEEIKEIEHTADRHVFEISNAVTSGSISPNLIDDMIRFVDIEDNIVDTLFNIARALHRYKCKDRKSREYVRTSLTRLSNLSGIAFDLLYEMHSASDIDSAMKLRGKIEALEQHGDDIKDAMVDYAYSSKLDFKSFYHIQNVAYLADDVLDGCEDSADMIVSILRSMLT